MSPIWVAVILTVPAFNIVTIDPFCPEQVAILGSELVKVTGELPLPPVAEIVNGASPYDILPNEEKLILLNTIKEAVEEKNQVKPPKYNRELFKLVKKIIEK